MKKLPSLDVLIIDIDNTFIYHRTVALANRLVVENWCRLFGKKIYTQELYTTEKALGAMACVPLWCFRWDTRCVKKLLILASSACTLYSLNLHRILANKMGLHVSNERMIRAWAKTIQRLRLISSDYVLAPQLVKRNLRPQMLALYKNIRRQNPALKVVAISQHFAIDGGPLQKLLSIDVLISNRLKVRANRVVPELVCLNGEDKLRLAKRFCMGAASVGVFIEDFDELPLLKLPSLAAVFCSRHMRRYLPSNPPYTVVSFPKPI